MTTLAALLLALFLAATGGCSLPHKSPPAATDAPTALPPGALGSRQNPVKCDGPLGELQYLRRLRGPDGQPVRFQRLGDVGSGVFGHLVDLYLVESQDGIVQREIYMDMYFPGYRENQAVPGFSLSDAPP